MNPPYRARDRPLPADTPWLNNTLTLRKEMLLMKKFTKVIALILSLTLLLCFPTGVSAAEPEGTGADTAAKGSLTIYKVDLTSAEKDGAWDSSYVSTGVYDQNVNDTLTSYALKDVEFTYLRVADVVQVTESTADGGDFDHVETLYGISKTAGADLLNALGLGNGAKRYEKTDGSDQLDDSNYYYQSDTLISALSTALKANATTVKNALEAYVTESGTAMPLTDTYGKTRAEDLELGLYLVVETKVPEMVTSTCNPFFICLPMTSSGGSWIYDVTVYPKNLTGNPTLDKTLRECKDDTGKGDFSKVQFIMQNKTDGYYVKAKLDEATSVYYVTDHVADKKDATRFVPTVKDGKGKILIKGLEDDEYTVTEIKTADGYTLLKKGIAVVISRKDASASAAVDGKQAAMLADNGSANALVPLSVVNTSGFDLPATGDRGVWMYGLAGILLMTASAACIIIARKRFK